MHRGKGISYGSNGGKNSRVLFWREACCGSGEAPDRRRKKADLYVSVRSSTTKRWSEGSGQTRGVQVSWRDEKAACPGITEGTVIIRSHGVPATDVYRELEAIRDWTCVDATCPYVQKDSQNCREYGEQGRQTDHHHRQRQTTRRWRASRAGAPDAGDESSNRVQEARAVSPRIQQANFCVVSQTTFNYNKFKELVEIISKKSYDIIVLNTICSATEERQTEARSHCGRCQMR